MVSSLRLRPRRTETDREKGTETMYTRFVSSLGLSIAVLVSLLAPNGALAQAAGSTAGGAVQAQEAPKSDTAPAQPTVEDSEHAIKLRGLEERVNDLKERIFRSKARLILLRETVMNGVISGAKAVVIHRNEMGSSFALAQVSYSLDGAPIYNKTDEKEEIELFNGSIVPGNHNLSVFMVYRGNGYGVFSYLKGYNVKVKSSYAFTAEEGKITSLKVVGYEKGGITTDFKDRPAVRYEMEVKQDVTGPAAKAAPTEKPAAEPAGQQ